MNHEVIEFTNGQKIRVVQATHRHSIVRAALSLEAEELWKKEEKQHDGVSATLLSLQHYDQTYLYPTLLACSEPVGKSKQIPTYEQFGEMTDEDVHHWIETVARQNPTWLPEEAEKQEAEPTLEATESKKDESPIVSISD